MSSIATITPFYRGTMSDDEKIALRHLRHFLGGYDNIAIAPPDLAIPVEGFAVERFPAECFADLAAYNHLLLTEEFYARFSRYDYILIYQLDCLVFSNKLKEWCEAGWDYIGAPWLTDFAQKGGGKADLWHVGNGGFSLRRVNSCRRILREYGKWNAARFYWRHTSRHYAGAKRLLRLPKLALKLLLIRHPLRHHLDQNVKMEDWFWGVDANDYIPGFKVPPPDLALSFAFEPDPAFCFERNGRQLPFGCHAWAKYDRKFWEPYLQTDAACAGGRQKNDQLAV
jgi:Protein of unknown function (DUF5672)